ncbi:uncharacterized protein LOC107493513 [Arachis duranensis]|uniref:Uncharacterized protein LOC107493513 n=1 Tax=Arachis duranensis TaxID=130453 RepID=A0A6P4DL29_ARADU|nr:uncharacterized protein LOC107493513 [Arachis duranensis]
MRKMKAAIIKLDFQKAYDKVKWKFVDLVLQKMSFGQRWRAWVMECVSSCSMSVLINGSPSKPFKMERGLRQGDPLSPFLFVLVVDVLHRMLEEAVRNGRLSPLLVGRDHIELSHLYVLGCKLVSLPVKYLGISLGANPRLVKTWKLIIDKVEEKLSLWKAKALNKAGGPWKDICQLQFKNQEVRQKMITGLAVEVVMGDVLGSGRMSGLLMGVAGGNGSGGYIKLQLY